jgi:hypothetical protein
MLRFNMASGLPAWVAPTVAQAVAQYWSIGHVDRNWNPQRLPAKRDSLFNETETALIEKRQFHCRLNLRNVRVKVDRKGRHVPRTTSCQLYFDPPR